MNSASLPGAGNRASLDWPFSRRRALDVFVAGRISFPDVLDFISGCQVLADELVRFAPDILVVPLRGAGPFSWVAERLLPLTAPMPLLVTLPVGTRSTSAIHDGRGAWRLSGIRRSDKRRVVTEAFDDLVRTGAYTPGESRLMVIDEVQHGSTLTTLASLVVEITSGLGAPASISVFSFRDGRTTSRWIKPYRTLGRDLGVDHVAVTVRTLFTVDSVPLLDAIVDDHAGGPPGFPSLRIHPNVESRVVFAALAETYLDPGRVLEELRVFQLRPEAIGTTAPRSAVERIVGILGSSEPGQADRVSCERAIGWWEQLAGYVTRAGSTHDKVLEVESAPAPE